MRRIVWITLDDSTAADADAMLTQTQSYPGITAYPNCIVRVPLCSPNRATMLTGVSPGVHGVTHNGNWKSLDKQNYLPKWFQGAGWVTWHGGKWGNGYLGQGAIPSGWSDWHSFVELPAYEDYYLRENNGTFFYGSTDPANYSTDRLKAKALAALKNHAENDLLLMLDLNAPHNEPIPAPRHIGLPVSIPCFSDLNEIGSGKHPWMQALPPLSQSEMEVNCRKARRTLMAVDEAIVELLDAAGPDAVVLITSDNGRSRKKRWDGKRDPYEPSVRVPLLMRWPGSIGGTDERLVSSLDIPVTLCAWAGIVPGLAQEGIDFRSETRASAPVSWDGGGNEGQLGPSAVPAWDAVRTLTNKTVVYRGDAFTEKYDLVNDPQEMESVQ